MTASNFRTALDFIFRPENDGQQDDSAPGENFRTSYGVTQMTWDAAVRDGIVAGLLENATQAQVEAIYRARYWNAVGCSSLPDGVDLMAFNDAVLCGPGHAARLMQRIAGAVQDGAVGPETLRKVGAYGVKPMIDAIAAGDLEYFMQLHNAPMFIRGWTRRTNDCRALAYKLARLALAPDAPAAVDTPEATAGDQV